MSAIRIFTVMITVIVLSGTNAASEQPWTLCKNSSGIQSYVRTKQGSTFYECKGITVLDARIELVAEIIRDIKTYPQWFADCKEIQVLEQSSPDNMFIYFVYDAPWPVHDRDLVVKTRAERDWTNGVAIITVEPHPGYPCPKKNDYVRITNLSISFTLEYLSREETKVTMIFKVDPAGQVPAGLANMVTRNHPYKTLLAMKKMTTKQHYRDLAEKSVDRNPVEKFLSNKKKVNGRFVLVVPDKE